MPYLTDDNGVYVRNAGSAITHGRPAAVGNFVGVAIKQKARAWSSGLVNPETIATTEDFFLITKGTVEVKEPTAGDYSGFARGESIYIDDTNNTLTESASGNKPFGRVVEIATPQTGGPKRGVPAGAVRIDLDLKYSAVDAATF
jgi:hypothetical protein